MINENEKMLKRLNELSDILIVLLCFFLAFWLRFYVLPGGQINFPLDRYMLLAALHSLLQVFTFAAFGLYRPYWRTRLRTELPRLWMACLIDLAFLMSLLFLRHWDNYSRQTIAIFFLLSAFALSAKRYLLRRLLRRARRHGHHLKHVVLVGDSVHAHRISRQFKADRDMGFVLDGYVARQEDADWDENWLGTLDELEEVLTRVAPDEVISAIALEDFERTPAIISACEKTGCRLAIVPYYAEYMSGRPNFDDLNGLPLLNIRYIPLENIANAFVKRAMDVIGSGLLLLVSAPVMLICAIGVKLSSPGPIIFKQTRVGLDKKLFTMYKFRSMRVNTEENTGWSSQTDSRKTRFGSLIRKYSLDEFPQFWNVFKGDMSLVGPRPELPFFVERFKEEVPLYMVKHQVRPGITGWAQVNGLRGDTSIKKRIEHDVYYIEHWSLLFDLKILWMTVFGGQFKNDEIIQ